MYFNNPIKLNAPLDASFELWNFSIQNKNKDEYYDYIKKHVFNVIKAYYEYKYDLIKILNINPEDEISMDTNIENHDLSKVSLDEFSAYCNKWYPDPDIKLSDEEIEREYMIVWNNHIHRNKHHPEHWVINDSNDKKILLDMDPIYIVEMLCDWESFRNEDGSNGAYYYYYNVDKKEGLLSDKTRELVEKCLEVMK